MRRHRTLVAAAVGVVAIGLGGAGSCDRKGLGDAPVGNQVERARTVIVMPDQFPNLVVVCDGPTRIYVTTREAPPVLVADHPLCEGKPPLDR